MRHADLLAGLLAATLTIGLLWLGGISASAQVVLHLLVAAAAVLAARSSDRRLSTAAAARGFAAAGALAGALMLVQLVPLPASLLGTIAPGVVAARPSRDWWSLSSDPERTVGELAFITLIAGFAVVVAAWGAARGRRQHVETAAVLLLALLVTVGLSHVVLDVRSLFGVLEPRTEPTRFFAPFANANHLAAVVLLLLPTATVVAYRTRALFPSLVAVGGVALLLASGSLGALLAALAVCVFAALQNVDWSRTGRLALQVLAVGGIALAAVLVSESGSAMSRLTLWTDTVSALPQYWLGGMGGGTFGSAIEPFRTDGTFQAFAHAHNEPLEWVAEGGLLGVLVAVGIVWLLRPGPMRDDADVDVLGLGVLGIALHSFVEFPLQMPGIALLAAGAWAARASVFAVRPTVSPRLVRSMLVVAGLVQLGGAAWQVRTLLVDRAIAEVRVPERAPRAIALLEVAAPWRPELTLARSWAAERQGDANLAVSLARDLVTRGSHDANALRQASLVLARGNHLEEARLVLERAAIRAPSDYRNLVLEARVATAQGRAEDAVQAWDAAFRLGAPTSLLAEAYAQLPIGVVWLERLEDSSPYLSLAIGNIALREGDPHTALLAYEQAAALLPERFSTDPNRAAVMLAAGRATEAEAFLRPLLAQRGSDPTVLAPYADALAALGRTPEAAEVALRAAEQDASLRRRAIEAVERAHGIEPALIQLRKYELRGGLDPSLSLLRARLQRDGGDGRACRETIARSGVLDKAGYADVARDVLASCDQSAAP